MFWVAAMIAGAAFFGLALGGADLEFASAALTSLFALTAAIVLAFPLSREAAMGALTRHWAGLTGLILLIAYAIGTAGGFGGAASAVAPHASFSDAWAFSSLGLAALTAAASADAAGRNRLLSLLLVTPMVLALAILVDQIDGAADFFGLVEASGANRGLTGPFSTREELGAVFALFILLGAFAALDEIRRRPTPGAFGFPPLARRLMLPAGCILISLNVLAVSGARASMAAVIVGVLVMWAIMTSRLGRGTGPARLSTPAYAAIAALVACVGLALVKPGFELVFAAGGDGRPYAYLGETVDKAAAARAWVGFGFGSFPQISADLADQNAVLSGFERASTDFAVWRVEAGAVGIVLGLATLVAFLAPLGNLKDRGRRPSRGLALGVGVCVVCVVSGLGQAVLANPAVAHLAALLLGLSAAFVDAARRRATPTPSQMPNWGE
jgi:hypothetical protein